MFLRFLRFIVVLLIVAAEILLVIKIFCGRFVVVLEIEPSGRAKQSCAFSKDFRKVGFKVVAKMRGNERQIVEGFTASKAVTAPVTESVLSNRNAGAVIVTAVTAERTNDFAVGSEFREVAINKNSRSELFDFLLKLHIKILIIITHQI